MRAVLRCLTALALAGPVAAQQQVDSNADLSVGRPAFPAPGPRVVIDGGHYNFHTIDGRYAPFARLLANDGLTVTGSSQKITEAGLRGVAVLVIANPLAEVNAPERWYLPTPSAFTPQEIAAIERFVKRGGGLFLIADHMPFAGAAHDLGALFGVEFENGYAFSPQSDSTDGPDLFNRENGGLVDDPAVAGVRQVATFTGSAFTARAPGVRPILRIGPQWTVLEPDTAGEFNARTPEHSGKGRLQGALVEVGRGRVAVFGEAAMFTAQVTGPKRRPMGLRAPGAEENKQFALDIVRWLVRGDKRAAGN